jgi:hypothetical protein
LGGGEGADGHEYTNGLLGEDVLVIAIEGVFLGKGTMVRYLLAALVLGVGVLRRLVNRDDVGPGGSTEAS